MFFSIMIFFLHLLLCYFHIYSLICVLLLDFIIQFERKVLINGTVVERILLSHPHLKGQFDNQPVVRPIQDEVLKMMVENDHAAASK